MKRLAVLLLVATSLSAEGRRYIVELAPHVRLRDAVARDGVVDVRRELTHALHAAIVDVRDDAALRALERMPGVVRVTPDWEAAAQDTTLDDEIRTAAPIATNATGKGIVVAVIDSGIDRTHPALAGRVIGGWDFVNDDADPMDDNRHGTHVAGIIAARGAVTGVAPDVSLLAYKVLNAEGRGAVSDILAAIDRALDPNGDGNSSDRADVINLSLGAPGHADDPLSRAVAHAVGLGAVVCASAGNEGRFHAIGSPGVAPLAITVGASDGRTSLADFSSRGPATGSGGIKPDLLAPGVAIRSTGPGGGYITLSGTSMASPYVAGLAALLLEEHPAWSPAMIKAALVSTSTSIGEEPMAEGAGVVTFERAEASDLFVETTQLDFGLDGTSAVAWQSVRTLAMRNDSASPRTVRLTVEGVTASISVVPAVSEVTLAPGLSAQIAVVASVDNTTLTDPATGSLSFGGVLTLSFDGGSARVPWSFVRAARATVTYEGSSTTPQPIWRVAPDTYGSIASIGPGGVETLVEPGTYDLAVISWNPDDVRVIVADAQRIEGDVRLPFTAASAPHEIRFDAMPDAMPDKASGDDTLYSLLVRFNAGAASIPIPMQQRVLHTSAFGAPYSILGTEAFVDGKARTVRIAQHPPVRAVAEDVALRALPGDYDSQEIVLHAPTGTTGRTVTLMPRDWSRDPEHTRPRPESLDVPMPDEEWRGTLLMTREQHDDFASGLQISVRTDQDRDGLASLVTPMIRRDDLGFFSTRGFEKNDASIYAATGEALEFGAGAVFLPTQFTADAAGLHGWPIEVRGDREELRRQPMSYRVIEDAAGGLVAAGDVAYGMSFIPINEAGAYRAEIATDGGVLTMRFDTTSRSAVLPSFETFAVVDGAGRRAARLPFGGSGAVLFSARDAVPALTKAFFRRKGTNAWVQLTAVETSDDVYRIDLRDALRLQGEMELAIELASEDGSTSSWRLERAFVSENMGTRRQRAVGR